MHGVPFYSNESMIDYYSRNYRPYVHGALKLPTVDRKQKQRLIS